MKYLVVLLGIVLVMVNVIVAPTGLHAQEDDNSDTWLYFVSDRDGNREIYRMRPDGSGQQNLTNDPATDGLAQDAWTLMASPDQAWLYFTTDRDGNFEIYRMRPDGSDTQNLTQHSATDTFVIPPDAYWSPDGGWLAFQSNRDANQEIYIMRPDGSEQQNISLSPCNDSFRSWMPTNEIISAYAFCEGLYSTYLIDLATNQTSITIDKVESRTYSVGTTADGSSIFYRQQTADGIVLYRYSVASQSLEALTEPLPDAYVNDYHADWLYFSATTDNEGRSMYRVDVLIGDVEELLDIAGDSRFTKLINDTVYFSHQPAERPTETDVYMLAADGSVQKIATLPYERLDLSGFIIDDWLYFVPYIQNERSNIYRVNLTTQAIEQLTSAGSNTQVFVVLTDE